jgi:cytoskeletal protein CcmA (bactofilin family)
MFRKKDTDNEGSTGGEGVLRRPGGESTQTELPPRKVDLGTGSGPIAGTGAPAVSPPVSRETEAVGKRLIVGQGIRLSGEISSCDRLVVEGAVEATLNDTMALEIAESGRFTGGCEVEEADISGVYEGDLTVRKRLFVRATGRLTGTVQYGELELERGGQIAGNISVMSMGSTSTGSGAAQAARALRQRTVMPTSPAAAPSSESGRRAWSIARR